MKLYAIVITVLFLISIVGYIKYRISTLVLSYYLLDKKGTVPTEEELEQCTKYVVSRMFKRK